MNQLKWNRNPSDDAGEPEGVINSPAEFLNHSSLVVVAKEGMRVLTTHFPGHMWAIQINEFGRVFNIFNHCFHNLWGWVLRADEVEHQPSRKRFLECGGQLLERFGHPAGRFDIAVYSALKKDPRGNCIPVYLSDLECAAAKKEIRKLKLAASVEAGNHFMDAQGRVLVPIQGN